MRAQVSWCVTEILRFFGYQNPRHSKLKMAYFVKDCCLWTKGKSVMKIATRIVRLAGRLSIALCTTCVKQDNRTITHSQDCTNICSTITCDQRPKPSKATALATPPKMPSRRDTLPACSPPPPRPSTSSEVWKVPSPQQAQEKPAQAIHDPREIGA